MRLWIFVGFAVASALGVGAGVSIVRILPLREVIGLGSPSGTGSSMPMNTDPEADVRRHEALLRRFESEVPDPGWGVAAAAKLKEDLVAPGGERAFTTRAVECRSTMCGVTVEWPTYDSARREYRQLARRQYSLNCLRDIYVPIPGDASRPYTARLLLDCRELRAHTNVSHGDSGG